MSNHTHARRAAAGRAGLLLALCLLPALACGRFEPRPTPLPLPPSATATRPPPTRPSATPTATLPATPDATPTFTPTPLPGEALRTGQPARVVAPQGVNIRAQPSTRAARGGRFGTGVKVTVQEGPVDADGYRWWKVSDSSGNAGWIADGDGQTVWLTPKVGDPRPVDRAIQPSDSLVVTADGIALRAFAGKDATLLREVAAGTRFSIIEGPVDVDGFRWWHVKNAQYEGWAAERTSRERLLSAVE